MNVAPLIPLLLVWVVVGTVLTFVDLREHRLPNALTLPMLVVTPVGLAVADVLDDNAWSAGTGWAGALWGALLWGAVIGLIWLLSRGRGMGLGDVKLSPSLGATLGWLSIEIAILGLVLSFILGGAVSAILLIAKKVGRRDAVPFGPFLLAGALIAVVFAL